MPTFKRRARSRGRDLGNWRRDRVRRRRSARARRRADPAHPIRRELRSGLQWLCAFPRLAWQLVAGMWRSRRRTLLTACAVAVAVALVLLSLGTGGREIWSLLSTITLGALVVGASSEHRTTGAIIVSVLALALVGTLAGPRWSPSAPRSALVPQTSDTAIGGDVTTPDVGTYEVSTARVRLTMADGRQVDALLRSPVGVSAPTPGVVFIHGAGTHTEAGFAEQAQALASAGATTLVPSKPVEGYSLTGRDYPAMADQYAQAVDHLRQVQGVDPARVGVYAESEGNFPGVVLAAQDPQIAFLILASAPVVPLREQATYAAGSYLQRVGVPRALMTMVARVLGSRTLPGDAFAYADFDPRPYEQRIEAPVLMVYGTADSSMPIVQGPQTISQSLREAGNDQLTVRYYEGANHGLKLGHSTDGALAPRIARDLARWVMGLPATAAAAPHVAGATAVQDFGAQAPGPTRWYASGDLMLASIVTGLLLMLAAGVIWVIGQAPRLGGRRGLHLPDPLGRWTSALALSAVASWVLYLAYIAMVADLAVSYSSNWWISYGGWLAAQLMALVTVVLLVKVAGRAWLMRGHERHGRHEGGRWLTLPSASVLGCVLTGAGLELVSLAYWGLFPLLH